MNESPYRLFAISAISGISNAFLIGIINAAAETVAGNAINWKYFIMYLLAMATFAISKRYILDKCAAMIEMTVARMRYRLANKIRHTGFSAFEKYGTAVMYASLAQDAMVISNLSTTIISGFQQVLMIVFTLLYISTVSFLSAGLIAVGIVVGLFYYNSHAGFFETRWRDVSVKETTFLGKLGHILTGFKEISINRWKNEHVFNDYVATNNTIRLQRTKTSQLYNGTLIFAQVFFYLLLCIIVFGLSKFHPAYSNVTIKVVAAVLFIMGPLESLLYCIPLYGRANASAKNMIGLEASLAEELNKNEGLQIDPNSPAAYEVLPFESRIEIKGLGFQYPQKGDSSFKVGPIDLTIQKGELIFITGGNGSGKSTFLKMLTGLYQPAMGKINLDAPNNTKGTDITLRNHQQYQNLFATIFSDYHLFDKLNGTEKEPEPAAVKALLHMMELSEAVTDYADGGFSSISLSSGQKKRLALIAAILEDKAIYVFDEVAADLDPEFRNKFYHEILAGLKSRNKTLLVVSHDQQYWQVADRLLNFRDGTMQELTKKEVAALVSLELKHKKK